MYKKQVKKLILFFIFMIIADQATLYAGRRSRKTIFKASDERSYSVEGRKKTRKERQQKEQEILDRNISSTQQATKQAQEEKQKIRSSIMLAAQEKAKAEQKLQAETEQESKLEAELEEAATAEQKGFFTQQLAQVKKNISALKNSITNNKKIVAIGAGVGFLLGVGYKFYQFYDKEGRLKAAKEEVQQMLLEVQAKEENNLKIAQETGDTKMAEKSQGIINNTLKALDMLFQ